MLLFGGTAFLAYGIERRRTMFEMKPYQIDYYKKSYPPGTRIELTADILDEDIPKGACGTVVAVDDIGTLHTSFDNGRSLGVLPNVDSFKKIEDQSEPSVQEPKPNTPTVQSTQNAKKKMHSEHSR